ncbi:XRE family transcriptional regulator (plasmid) [Nostoc carneum NIES-2107]|nr:XRE family transcriptional regulator [Nostoc carneum NIES-2107]BAY35508.1 XRE family transcriptional regulator [Nostoc carneum NIES-2107]BAY35652.1 XRE family transcriptional regulator [Nostoc carneum NIES-2107]BAY35682.1 XRE family transcriptional regulator [Nostoc carneum NIES-2107]
MITEHSTLPTGEEGLANYVQRLRGHLCLTQKELSFKAGIHIQTIRKIEGGQTSRLNQKAKGGLASALGIPPEYLDAAAKKVSPETITSLKFCPKCWTPGTTPDPMWTDFRSKYCFACGTALRNRCSRCNEPIMSLKFKFCPYCGANYKQNQTIA